MHLCSPSVTACGGRARPWITTATQSRQGRRGPRSLKWEVEWPSHIQTTHAWFKVEEKFKSFDGHLKRLFYVASKQIKKTQQPKVWCYAFWVIVLTPVSLGLLDRAGPRELEQLIWGSQNTWKPLLPWASLTLGHSISSLQKTLLLHYLQEFLWGEATSPIFIRASESYCASTPNLWRWFYPIIFK